MFHLGFSFPAKEHFLPRFIDRRIEKKKRGAKFVYSYITVN